VTCPVTGKLDYPDRAAALQALRKVRARRSHAHKTKEGSVYRCPECRNWHLSSPRGKP